MEIYLTEACMSFGSGDEAQTIQNDWYRHEFVRLVIARGGLAV
jgi:hypothetical protein